MLKISASSATERWRNLLSEIIKHLSVFTGAPNENVVQNHLNIGVAKTRVRATPRVRVRVRVTPRVRVRVRVRWRVRVEGKGKGGG